MLSHYELITYAVLLKPIVYLFSLKARSHSGTVIIIFKDCTWHISDMKFFFATSHGRWCDMWHFQDNRFFSGCKNDTKDTTEKNGNFVIIYTGRTLTFLCQMRLSHHFPLNFLMIPSQQETKVSVCFLFQLSISSPVWNEALPNQLMVQA